MRRLPRIRFGLRTLLVLMTAVCVVAAAETKRVRERRLAAEEIRRHGGWVQIWVPFDRQNYFGCGTMANLMSKEVHIPAWRRWLGDQPISSVEVKHQRDFALARRQFPEAEIVLTNDEGLPLEVVQNCKLEIW